jgi:hypothetical protein
MFFRPSALPLVEEWRRVIREQPTKRWDQGEFNRVARMGCAASLRGREKCSAAPRKEGA